jgi:hypothetical protein
MVQLIGQVGTLRPPPFSCFLRVFPFPLVGPPTKWAGLAARFGLVVQFLFSAKFVCMGNRSNRLTAIQKKNQTSQIFPTWPFSRETPTLELLAPAPGRNSLPWSRWGPRCLYNAPEGAALERYPGAARGARRLYNARMYGGRPTLELPTLELPWTPVGHMYVYFWGATYPRAACPPRGEKAYPGAGKGPPCSQKDALGRRTPPLEQPALDPGIKS